jgi:tetratricopeptide (TPR) repeat protein
MYHTHALEINKKYGNTSSVQINLANIALSYSNLKKYSKALEYHFAALKVSEETGNPRDIAINMGNIGETYYLISTNWNTADKYGKQVKPTKSANLLEAVSWLEKATSTLEQIKYFAPLTEFGPYLAEAYFLSSDLEKAYRYHMHFTAIKDSVFSQENKAKLASIATQFEVQLKDRTIALKNKEIEVAQLSAANKRKESFIYLISIVVLLAVIVVVVKKYIADDKSHKNVMNEISQMQSHEIRGPVARILGLIQLFNKEDDRDPINKELIIALNSVAIELDTVIKKVVKKTNA